MLRKLDIVVILVKDWPTAVQWYIEKLGLEIVYQEDEDQWCQLSFPEGDTRLALLGADTIDMDSQSRCVPDILVDDLARIFHKP